MASSNDEAICFYNQLKGHSSWDLKNVYENLAEEHRSPRHPLGLLFSKGKQ